MREDFGVVIRHSALLMAFLVTLWLNLVINVLMLSFLAMDLVLRFLLPRSFLVMALLVMSFLLTWSFLVVDLLVMSFLVMALLVTLLVDSESVLRLNRSRLGCSLNWSEIDVNWSQILFLLKTIVLSCKPVHVKGCWMEDDWWIHGLNDVMFELGN